MKENTEKEALIKLAERILSKQASDEEIAGYNHWFNTMEAREDLLPENEVLKEAALLARIRTEIKIKEGWHIHRRMYVGVVAAILCIFIGVSSYFFRLNGHLLGYKSL